MQIYCKSENEDQLHTHWVRVRWYIFFYKSLISIKKFHGKKILKKSIVLKLWSFISPKPAYSKTTESELFEP